MAESADYCQNCSYSNRIDDPASWNWCLVPDGGYDAVFFAGMAIVVMAVASPRWDALISLVAGGVYEVLNYHFNMGHVSNAVNLWLGMRPADIFVFVFLPPFLLDLSVRIDFFMLKKLMVNVLVMAFMMVITTCLVLIPFMLYGLRLADKGWTGGYVALFGAAIASTDAAAVCASLSAGGAPEILSVMLEGESLFNDASSLTLFEIFKEVVVNEEHKPLGQEIGEIVAKTVETALVGVALGLGFGIFNKLLFIWLQYRNMPAFVEVGFTVGGAYLTFYITQVWCHGSGCVGVVAYGLYGSATLLWGMSNKTRQSGIFQHFWTIMTFLVNALIFFYVGASSVNFTIRASNELYSAGGARDLVSVSLYKLPIIYVYVFVVRGVFLFISFNVLRIFRLGAAVSWQQILFLALGGIRGSLSLVLAQTIATLAISGNNADRVKAEAAMYTAGFVIMTLIINAPLSAPLMTMLGLNKISQEQLHMRGHVKQTFFRFTATALEELQGEAADDEMLQGVDWTRVEQAADFQTILDQYLPEVQPKVSPRDYFFPPWLRSCLARCYWVAKAPRRALARSETSASEATAETARVKDELARMTAYSLKQHDSSRHGLQQGSVPLFHASVPLPSAPTPSSDVLVISDAEASEAEGRSSSARRNTLQRTKSSRQLGGPNILSQAMTFMSRRLQGPGSHKSRSQRWAPRATELQSIDTTAVVRDYVNGAANGAVNGAAELPKSSTQQQATPYELEDQLSFRNNLGDLPTVALQLQPAQPDRPGQGTPAGVAPAIEAATAGAGPGSTAARGPASSGGDMLPGLPQLATSPRHKRTPSASAVSPRKGSISRLHMSSSSSGAAGLPPAAELLAGPGQGRSQAAGQRDRIPLLTPTAAGGGLHHSRSAGVLQEGELGATSPAAQDGDGIKADTGIHTARSVPLGSNQAASTSLVSSSDTGAPAEPQVLAHSPFEDLTGLAAADIGLAIDAASHAPDTEVVAVKAGTGDMSGPLPTDSQPSGASGGSGRGPDLQRSPRLDRSVRGSMAAPTTDSFMAHAASPLLVIDAHSAAKEALATKSMPWQRPQSYSAGTGGEDQPDSVMVQRRGGDGLLATTSMRVHPATRDNRMSAGLGRSSLASPKYAQLHQQNTDQMDGPQHSGPSLPDIATLRPTRSQSSAPGTARPMPPDPTLGGGSPKKGMLPGTVYSAGGLTAGWHAGLPEATPALTAIAEREAMGGLSDPPQPQPPVVDACATNDTQPAGKQGGGVANAKAAGSRGLGRGSLGSRFFAAESERAYGQQGTSELEASSSAQLGKLSRPTLGTASKARSLATASKAKNLFSKAIPQQAAEADRPIIVRDSTDLIRSSKTGAPLLRLSRMSRQLFTNSGNVEDQARQMVMEYRLRLLTGLKQYFKAKYLDGILSPHSYKTLWYITNKAHHSPHLPLPLWEYAQQEVSSGRWLQAEAQCFHWVKLRENSMKNSDTWLKKNVVKRLLALPAWVLSGHLNRVQLAGLEAAVELWISLTASLQTQWLQYSGPFGAAVLEEVRENAEGAWSYIVARRIEAPEKFEAIQTYRATVHLLSQQLAFVEEMSHGGMIDESEASRMEETMTLRLQRICRAGPQWRRQSLKEILAGVPFLRTQHPKVLNWIRKHSSIKMYAQGECIWEHWQGGAQPSSMFIVIAGVVRLQLQAHGRMQSVYLGSGGVGGLMSMVLDTSLPSVGMLAAYAEGNALGKGPVVMHIPRALFVTTQHLSRIERLATWQQLELSVFRTAAAYVLDLLRDQVQGQLGLFVRSALAACVCGAKGESKVAQRQRIRALLKDALEAELVGVDRSRDGAGAPLNHLDWVAELLAVPHPVALALLDGSLDQSLATQPWHKAMFQAIAASIRAVYDVIRASVRDSCLVVLSPGQAVWQASTMVLLQGSLATGGPPASGHLLQPNPLFNVPSSGRHASGGDDAAQPPQPSEAELPQGSGLARPTSVPMPGSEGPVGGPGFIATPNEANVAPSVMVWTADYFDVEAAAQAPLQLSAGPRGASLLVYGADMQTLLTGNASLF